MKNTLFIISVLILFGQSIFGQKLDHVQGDILIQVKPETEVYQLARGIRTLDNQLTRLFVKRLVSAPLDIWLLHFDYVKIDENRMLDLFKERDEILVAQFNHLIYDRQNIPNDPLFNNQWQWLNETQAGGIMDADVDADLAWEIATGGQTEVGQDIVVCIIESGGADWDHADLIDNHWVNNHEIPNNDIDDDENGYVDDYNGWNAREDQLNDFIPPGSHGTRVSGMAGAVGNNSLGITGINWDVKLMQVVRGSLGNASMPNEANVLAAYTYPLVMRRMYNQTNGEKGAFVVVTNASWGIDDGDPEKAPLWCEMYNEMGHEGILSCGATNNSDNYDVDINGDLPTACPSDFLISVSSTNSSDILLAAHGLEHIDLAAPGESIYTTSPNGNYGNTTGTSFASPLVAGLVGLIYSSPCTSLGANAISDPANTALLVREMILEGVDIKPNLTGFLATNGRVNAASSMLLMLDNCDPCADPYGYLISGLTDTEATLSWSVTSANQTTNLRWRQVGTSDWNEIEDATSPYLLENMMACTSYEVQWQTSCGTLFENWTDSFIFESEGCCKAPENVEFSNITDSLVSISWDNIFAAQSYDISLFEEDVVYLFEDVAQNSFVFNNLIPCTDYSFTITTNCNNGDNQSTQEYSFETTGCGACLDLDYCTASAQNAADEWIQNVTLNTLNNTSQSDFGYGDYSGVGTDLMTFNAYDISLTPGYATFSFNEYFRVWIDFDQNGVFDDNELVLDPGETVTGTLNGTIIVPGDAVLGLTRMRVMMRFSNPPEVCDANYDHGEVEDYCINIIEGTPPDCLSPIGIEMEDVSFTEASFIWQSTVDALEYNARIKPTSGVIWDVFETPNTNITFENLQDCTEYEIQVRSACIGTFSDWTDSFVFETICAVPCDDIPDNLDTLVVGLNFAEFIWESTPNAIAYNFRYRDALTTPWNILEFDTTQIFIDGLEPCRTYEYSVQALCFGSQSDFSEIKSFETICNTSSYQQSKEVASLQVFPNPFFDHVLLEFDLKVKTQIEVRLLDVSGKQLYQMNNIMPFGKNTIRINELSQLDSGVYFLMMESESGVMSRRLVKI